MQAGVDHHMWPAGITAGPFFRVNAAGDYDIYIVVLEVSGLTLGATVPGGSQPGGSTGYCQVWKATDGGTYFKKQDEFNAPAFAMQPDGCPGFAASYLSNELYIVIPRYKGTGGSPANDVALDIRKFDCSTDTWGSLLATNPNDSAVALNSVANAPAPYQMVQRSNGDLVLAYVKDVSSADKVYLNTYDVSGAAWLGEQSSGDSGGVVPVSMLLGTSDTIHLANWNVSSDTIEMVAMNAIETLGTYRTAQVALGSPGPAAWPTGRPLLYDGTLYFPFVASVGANFGVQVATATAGTDPTFTETTLLSGSDITADPGLKLVLGGANLVGNPSAVEVNGSVYVVWAGDYRLVASKLAGTWGAADYIPFGEVPSYQEGGGVEDVANLSIAKLPSNLDGFGILGAAKDSASSSWYTWYRTYPLVTGASGSGGNSVAFG